MVSRFKDYIVQHDLVGAKDRVLLAVSGGLDSMVMLHLFHQTGYTVGVAHGNFGLRGNESDGDEAFVRKFCVDHGIPFFSQRFHTKNYAETRKVSVQMAARELRYEWFNQLLEKEKYHWLATAHHLNDNVETVLLRFTNGAGLDQLTGIPRRNEKIIRPMLFASRADMEAFARESKIVWREDASNLSAHYQRNFIRHEVIPRLKEINPSLEQTFALTLEKLDGAAEQMHRGLGQLRDTITHMEGRDLYVDKNLLILLRNPTFVCYEWLRPLGFDFERCKQLVAAIPSQPGARFFSETHVAVVDRESIIISPREETFHEVLLEEGQDKAALGPWLLNLRPEKGRTISDDPMCATVDFAKVRFPLLWRLWKAGDSFVPLGMTKKKKISDFLVDEHVSMTDKGRVTVLASGEDIIWVAGYRLDDRFKVSKETSMVLVVRLSKSV